MASYEEFKQVWLEEILEGSPSTVELGHRFSRKLIGDWLDFSEDTEDIIFCDGAGDGGIDVAYLLESVSQDGSSGGNTWYLVQSKHGKAFSGVSTIFDEGRKVLATLKGENTSLSSMNASVVERIKNFILNAGENDKLRLVYATHDPLNEQEKQAVEDIRNLGVSKLGAMFDVDAISIQSIYNRICEYESSVSSVAVDLKANLVLSGDDLWVGSSTLLDVFDWLKDYKGKTGDLDQIYEKNVRKYLGGGKIVNKEIAKTLKTTPEKFGLFNNGITIVAEDIVKEANTYHLSEPYIVNGCQTTKTIWQIMKEKLDTGATGMSPETANWKSRASKGIVVVKLVKVGADKEKDLTDITRYTNSQNSVSRQDFIALEQRFRVLSSEFSQKYSIYLEIHRGGWESIKLQQRQRLVENAFRDHVNAFDMLKIYGAGWLAEPGTAYGKNPPFAPGGTIFRRINDSQSFDIEEIYACYLIKKVADEASFGRNAIKPSRGQTRYLFYYVLIELLKQILVNKNMSCKLKDITESLVKIYSNPGQAANELSSCALYIIDSYLDQNDAASLFVEPEYLRTRDLNSFLKWEQLGKNADIGPKTPKLELQLYKGKFTMNQLFPGQTLSKEEIVANAITQAT